MANLPTKPIGSIEFLVVHCAATPPNMDIGVAEIRKWHLQRGFADVGYHYVIRRNGVTEKGRPDTVPGAHAEGYNMHSLGICLVGGLLKGTTKAQDNFEPIQKSTLFTLLTELHGKYPTATILGHRDLPGVRKACPSFDVSLWLKGTQLEESTRGIRNEGGPSAA